MTPPWTLTRLFTMSSSPNPPKAPFLLATLLVGAVIFLLLAVFLASSPTVIILLSLSALLVTLFILVDRGRLKKIRLSFEATRGALEAEIQNLKQRQTFGVEGEVSQVLQARLDTQEKKLLEVHFRFSESSNLVKRLLDESELFSREQVKEVLSGFQSLEQTAKGIKLEVQDSFQKVLDVQSRESLYAIVEESKTIDAALNEFFIRLGRLLELTHAKLHQNKGELAKVKKMALAIEEFFENIRMISLNLSIEASRVGGGKEGRSFQVLAQRLREFSTRAQEISVEQMSVVDSAERVIDESAITLRAEFDHLSAEIPQLKDRLDPFPKIIDTTRESIDQVLNKLSRLSDGAKELLTQVIGRLQFQDLSRQEYEHVADFLEALSRFDSVNSSVDPSLKRGEQVALAQLFSKLLTTANERKVLQTYIELNGLPQEVLGAEGAAREAGAVELF